MNAPISLSARLDLTAARPLAAEIAAREGDLLLDASSVTHLGGLCLQILLAAEMDCVGSGRTFGIVNRSAEFDSALDMFGVEFQHAPGKTDA